MADNGRSKWLLAIFGSIIALCVFLVGVNRAEISEMPDKYVRLERYKCDIDDIKLSLRTIEIKIDRLRK